MPRSGFLRAYLSQLYKGSKIKRILHKLISFDLQIFWILPKNTQLSLNSALNRYELYTVLCSVFFILLNN